MEHYKTVTINKTVIYANLKNSLYKYKLQVDASLPVWFYLKFEVYKPALLLMFVSRESIQNTNQHQMKEE